ncbi:glutaredoxin domain-containing protein [Ordospora colligata]|uniref:Glutaredoxin domain-containing protein n=1 Tax=Ordospora colligata OC4 TaxID=1354746 RepID=A0A0B2ULA6_9MICR|nr:glutaredoxin domain-containing protein [Ordospora colligata OC4]KHN69792.1 glutaredoxin domain-containing protein [Ordospora colligata OC4]TBU15595.1 glutaredoxin domain-containing protein [Ordospora colligata]TBU15662.1 glutaredoxin domain-containing protein [Ordospora colligata]TBU18713.1 glutaredoxin domain-containing protein [Ordospora colligata]
MQSLSMEDDLFDDLKEHEMLVVYENEEDKLYNELSVFGIEYAEAYVGGSEELKIVFMKHFNLSKFPVLILNGMPVLDNIESKVEEYMKLKDQDVMKKIEGVMDPKKIVVFIKGSPESPKCGFTRSLIDTLLGVGVSMDKIAYFDILKDEDVRRKMKVLNNWPTFPQVYIKGEFVGGLDVIKQMNAKGQLTKNFLGIF